MTTAQTRPIQLTFGKQSWPLNAACVASVWRERTAVSNLSAAVDAALTRPIDFASIDQAFVPGDVVALAVDPATPSLVEVVCEVSEWLAKHGTAPENIRIVLAVDEGTVSLLSDQLTKRSLTAVQIQLHDADNSQELSYLAANDQAEAIYINRTLVDADVVIPVSCARSKATIDYLGAFGIFPLFSNRQVRGHLNSFARLSVEEQRSDSISQADQAAWWLGLMFGIQVLPSANDQVGAILCGALSALEDEVQRQLSVGLKFSDSLSPEADLVIALVDGPQQDWASVARALHNARSFCSLGGSIVVCTELQQPIGASLKRLRGTHSSRQQIEKRLSRDTTDDSLVASVILDSTRDRHVYLVSQLKGQAVEDLGLGVLETSSQLASLVHQHSKNVVIYSAQHP